jgi:hypothetical protein
LPVSALAQLPTTATHRANGVAPSAEPLSYIVSLSACTAARLANTKSLPGGELRIMSTEKVRERIRNVGERVIAEHGEALQILVDHDPDAPRR